MNKPAMNGASKPLSAEDDQTDEVQSPSLITELHVQDRETSKVAGAPRAWRKMQQLEAAYLQERLGARDGKDARRRLEAGSAFTRLWDTAQSAGRDSTAAFDFAGGGQGLPITEAQQAAIRHLVAIEMHLGQRDRTIIRAVCAWGHSPAEAIVLAKLESDTRVTARFCEALDALADALDRTAKSVRRH